MSTSCVYEPIYALSRICISNNVSYLFQYFCPIVDNTYIFVALVIHWKLSLLTLFTASWLGELKPYLIISRPCHWGIVNLIVQSWNASILYASCKPQNNLSGWTLHEFPMHISSESNHLVIYSFTESSPYLVFNSLSLSLLFQYPLSTYPLDPHSAD